MKLVTIATGYGVHQWLDVGTKHPAGEDPLAKASKTLTQLPRFSFEDIQGSHRSSEEWLGKVLVVGFDNISAVQELIRSGDVVATADQHGDQLAVYGIGVDAEVGRQFPESFAVVRRMVRRDELPRNVIIHLGTNGYVQPADCDKLISLAPGRRIFLTSVRVPRDWQDPNNDVLNACAARYDRVFILRWSMYSKDHPEWFASDGYHLNAIGQQAYTDFLYGDVREVLRTLRRR